MVGQLKEDLLETELLGSQLGYRPGFAAEHLVERLPDLLVRGVIDDHRGSSVVFAINADMSDTGDGLNSTR